MENRPEIQKSWYLKVTLMIFLGKILQTAVQTVDRESWLDQRQRYAAYVRICDRWNTRLQLNLFIGVMRRPFSSLSVFRVMLYLTVLTLHSETSRKMGSAISNIQLTHINLAGICKWSFIFWERIRGQREFSIPGILDESQLHFFSLDHEKWFSKVSISSRNTRITICNLVLVSKYENGHMIISICGPFALIIKYPHYDYCIVATIATNLWWQLPPRKRITYATHGNARFQRIVAQSM